MDKPRILRNALFGLYSAMLLFVSLETIRKVIELASDWSNSHASQILAIPFISAWLIWINRKTVFQNARLSLLPGATVIALGGFLWLFDKTGFVPLNANDHLSVMTASIIVTWLGGFLVTYGRSAFRNALFPLLLLFLAVPIPSSLLDLLVEVLQVGSAEMAYGLIKVSGTPIYRTGFLFAMPNLVVEVAPACSGIRSGIAIFIAGLLAGHLFLRSAWNRTFLVCVAVAVLLFKNAMRIAVLSLLAVYLDRGIIASPLHREGGIPFLILGLLLLYPFLVMLVRSERSKTSVEELPRSLRESTL